MKYLALMLLLLTACARSYSERRLDCIVDLWELQQEDLKKAAQLIGVEKCPKDKCWDDGEHYKCTYNKSCVDDKVDLYIMKCARGKL